MRRTPKVSVSALVMSLVVMLPACGGPQAVSTPSSPSSPTPDGSPVAEPVSVPVTVGEPASAVAKGTCPVTRPADRPVEPPGALVRWLEGEGTADEAAEWYGGGGLWVLPAQARQAYPRPEDGKWGIKLPWWRDRDERLEIRAVSLDTGETVVGDVPEGYSVPGLQVSGFDFPRLGCWHITGTLGATQVRFVTKVVRAPRG